jgi:cyclophilin family peptidyl-prolyl cis-trans isomerase
MTLHVKRLFVPLPLLFALYGFALGGSAWRTGPRPGLDHAPADSNPVVVLETNKGEIRLELFPELAPKTVEHFLRLVESGFYDEMVFHRVVRDYVIQTGHLGMDGQVRGLDVEPIENEAGSRHKNLKGSVAMARTDDPHSATTDFFISVRNNPDFDFKAYTRQDWGYAVFGRVISGMNIVEEISRIETRRTGPYREFPTQPVAIYSAYVMP